MQNSDKRLLTICIPSYNRAPYVKAQVAFLCNFVHDRGLAGEIEIIVANNRSTDDTIPLIRSLPYNNFILVNHPVHYLTAEENIMRSLESCSGEYVWFLGDDDPVNAAELESAIALLRTGAHDCLIYNSRTIRGDGSVAISQPLKMNAPAVEMDVRSLVEAIGVVYTFAGISNLFIRRDLLDSELGLKWLKAAPIYSHVAWFIDALKGRTVRFCNSSIVNYRQNDYSNGHWDRMAEKLDVPSYYFWTMGLIVLLEGLIVNKALSYTNIANIFEPSAEGNKYRLLNEIYFSLFRQMNRFAETLSVRETYDAKDLERISRFFLAADPAYFNLVEVITEGCKALFAKTSIADAQAYMRTFESRFHTTFNAWTSGGLYRSRYVGRYNDFDIYAFPDRFFGVHSTIENPDHYLDSLDPIEDGLTIVSGETREKVAERALEASLLRARTHQSTPSAAPAVAPGGTGESGAELAAIKASTSWRITAPLRALVTAFRR